MLSRKTKKRVGPLPKAQNTVRMQLKLIELVINAGWNYRDPYFLKMKRRYLLKRLLALQLKEFDKCDTT